MDERYKEMLFEVQLKLDAAWRLWRDEINRQWNEAGRPEPVGYIPNPEWLTFVEMARIHLRRTMEEPTF